MVLTDLKKEIEAIVGPDWASYEPETILSELPKEDPWDNLMDLIQVLLLATNHPGLFFEDGLFFLYATDALAGNVPDFDYLPVPNSIEMVVSLMEMFELTGKTGNDFTDGMKATIAEILRQDGYQMPVWPFQDIVTDSDFPEREEDYREIMAKKEEVNRELYKYMTGEIEEE